MLRDDAAQIPHNGGVLAQRKLCKQFEKRGLTSTPLDKPINPVRHTIVLSPHQESEKAIANRAIPCQHVASIQRPEGLGIFVAAKATAAAAAAAATLFE